MKYIVFIFMFMLFSGMSYGQQQDVLSDALSVVIKDTTEKIMLLNLRAGKDSSGWVVVTKKANIYSERGVIMITVEKAMQPGRTAAQLLRRSKLDAMREDRKRKQREINALDDAINKN